jgi:hypothetical protein
LHSLVAWKRALADGSPPPRLPHIERCEG